MVSPEKALEELKSSADTQFDPLLVETFAQMVNTGRILS
jgi:HD-GYP domain-containing protein (c-di-GMP phosphodiesterase class II)